MKLKQQVAKSYFKVMKLGEPIELFLLTLFDYHVLRFYSSFYTFDSTRTGYMDSGIASNTFSFEDLFKNFHTVKSGSSTKLTTDGYLSLSSNVDQKTVPVIFDTGASLGITHRLKDCVKPPTVLHIPLFLGGMADGLESCDKSEIQIITDGYYVLSAKAILLSPQRFFNQQQGFSGFYKGNMKMFSLCLQV